MTFPSSKPPTDRRHARKLATRLAILEAAERVVLADGYAALTTKRLVEEAGVSERTIFNHFDSLEHVVLSRVGDLLIEMFKGHTLPVDLAPAELPQAIDSFYREHIGSSTGAESLQKFAHLALSLGSLMASDEDAIGSAVLKALGELARVITQQVEETYPQIPVEFHFKLTQYIFNLSMAIAMGIAKAVYEQYGTTPHCINADQLENLPSDESLAQLRAGILWSFDQVNRGKPTL